MESVKKELVVGKESSEVIDAIAELVRDIRAGKDVAVIASENLASLVGAVEGYEKIGGEVSGELRNHTASYLVSQVLDALLPDEPKADEA